MPPVFYNFWFIQGIGAIALVFILLAWNAKERKNIFLLQSINLIFFVVHYALLAAYAGAAMCLVTLGRNFVFGKKSEKPWASNVAWPFIFLILAIAVLIFFWNGWITVFPVAGVAVGIYGMWKDRPAEIRYYMLISCLIWVPYTIIVQSWPGLLSQVVGAIGILMGMYRHDREVV